MRAKRNLIDGIHTHTPLGGWTVHDDVDPQNLHGVEGVGQAEEGGESDEGEGRNAPEGGGGEEGTSLDSFLHVGVTVVLTCSTEI